jgi:hypothetical protein
MNTPSQQEPQQKHDATYEQRLALSVLPVKELLQAPPTIVCHIARYDSAGRSRCECH